MASTDYELVLNRLFGEDTVTQLREFVKKGDIDGIQVSSIAERAQASVPYQENRSHGVVVAFDEVLKYWVNEQLFNYRPEEAKQLLLDVLTKARCSNRIVHTIKSMTVHHTTDGGGAGRYLVGTLDSIVN